MTSPSSSNTTRAAMKSCSSTPALMPRMPSWRSHTRSKALLCLTNTSSESSFPRIGCSKRVSLNVHSCIYETRYKWWISVSFLPFFLPRLAQHTRRLSSVCALLVLLSDVLLTRLDTQWQQQNRIRWFYLAIPTILSTYYSILKNN